MCVVSNAFACVFAGFIDIYIVLSNYTGCFIFKWEIESAEAVEDVADVLGWYINMTQAQVDGWTLTLHRTMPLTSLMPPDICHEEQLKVLDVTNYCGSRSAYWLMQQR